jgi:hypothetical protein
VRVRQSCKSCKATARLDLGPVSGFRFLDGRGGEFSAGPSWGVAKWCCRRKGARIREKLRSVVFGGSWDYGFGGGYLG